MQSIFLVEDSPLLQQRLADLLADVPDVAVVGRARDARSAIDGILERKPDVVLLDLGLGADSGFDVLSAVRERQPGIDFYVLSNFAAEPYRRRARHLGARDFFDKSTDFQRVREVIAARGSTTH